MPSSRRWSCVQALRVAERLCRNPPPQCWPLGARSPLGVTTTSSSSESTMVSTKLKYPSCASYCDSGSPGCRCSGRSPRPCRSASVARGQAAARARCWSLLSGRELTTDDSGGGRHPLSPIRHPNAAPTARKEPPQIFGMVRAATCDSAGHCNPSHRAPLSRTIPC